MKNIVKDTGKYLVLCTDGIPSLHTPSTADILDLELTTLSLFSMSGFRILLVSITFGSVPLKQCFRNAYTIFMLPINRNTWFCVESLWEVRLTRLEM